jgi:hypothetical protein
MTPNIFSFLEFPPTLLEKPSVTQDQNMYVTENSVIHIERWENYGIHIWMGPLNLCG